MKKILKCFVIAVIISLACVAMLSSVEAVEPSDKLNVSKDIEEKSSLEEAKNVYDEYKIRKEIEDKEKARLREAERQRKKLEEEAERKKQEEKQKNKMSFGDMIGAVIFLFILSLFMSPAICWLVIAYVVYSYFAG